MSVPAALLRSPNTIFASRFAAITMRMVVLLTGACAVGCDSFVAPSSSQSEENQAFRREAMPEEAGLSSGLPCFVSRDGCLRVLRGRGLAA
jgi:hypothetical protein